VVYFLKLRGEERFGPTMNFVLQPWQLRHCSRLRVGLSRPPSPVTRRASI
jgi:hypothetical protein